MKPTKKPRTPDADMTDAEFDAWLRTVNDRLLQDLTDALGTGWLERRLEEIHRSAGR